MPRYFTYYWKNEFCEPEEEGAPERYLNHLAGNRFLKRGVKPGDFVYLVTVKKGELYLVARMEVGEIVDHFEAALLLNRDPDELWDAHEHLMAKPGSGTRLIFDRWIPLGTTQRLRFLNGGKGTPKPLWFEQPGVLDRQTLRSVRELTRESALELDYLIDRPSRPVEIEQEEMSI